MPFLAISLMGPARVAREGQPVSGLAHAKVLGLLAYLVMETDHPHRRESLAALLWPDQPPDRARHSLRQALSTLRDVIGDRAVDPPLLLIDCETVSFNGASDVTLDVAQFTAALSACASHAHQQRETCQRCSQRLELVAALYRGEFLAGFQASDSAELEEWIARWRERLQVQALDALTDLAASYEHRGEDDRARDVARRQLDIDPWREQAHRQLMRALALGGKRTAALAHYRYVGQLLNAELGVEPEEETTALVERIRMSGTGETIARDNLVRPSARPHNLPELSTLLLGRDRELGAVGDLLKTPDCRLLTLVGPGGIGKTQLAMQVGREQAASFRHGAYQVPLAQVRATEFVVPAIIEALKMAPPGRTEPKSHLLNQLKGREMLLVLDNLEHLLDGATDIADILASAPEVKILATSRERLNLHDEWVLEVQGLVVPPDDNVDGIAGYPAVKLFGERIRRVRSNSPVRQEEYPLVAHICRMVEGMPLAIELAAAWTPTLPLNEIAQELERNVDFLATSMRDLPERHRSMQAVFDHSWNLLREEEQRVFRRLSVFRGGFPLVAAEQVAGASPEVVAALVSKSFLRGQASGRYDIHELLRQLGERKLREDPNEVQETGDRHCEYHVAFLEQRVGALTGRDQERVLSEINLEFESIRSAWRWATEHRKTGDLCRTAHSLWLCYAARGWVREGEKAFSSVVEALAPSSPEVHSAQTEHTLALGMALLRQGSFCTRLGSHDQAIHQLQRSIALLRPLNAKREIGLALNLLAAATRPTGNTGQERELLEESIKLFEESEDHWGRGYSLNDLGMVAHLTGDNDEAARLCHASLAIFDQLGDLRGRAFALDNLGVIATALGNLEDAAFKHAESLALRQSLRDEWGSASALVHQAEATRMMGRYRQAWGWLLEGLRPAMAGRIPTSHFGRADRAGNTLHPPRATHVGPGNPYRRTCSSSRQSLHTRESRAGFVHHAGSNATALGSQCRIERVGSRPDGAATQCPLLGGGGFV